MTYTKQSPSTEQQRGSSQADKLCQELEAEIVRLKTFSNRGLWAFSLFLLACMMAWQNFPFLPAPDTVVALLGKPPSSQTISIMLLFYTFSAIILSLSRMMGGIEHKSSFCHVGYLTGFFLFYHYARALDDNYWAVFGSGITILGVESYRIWSYCNESITKKTEELDYIKKTGQMPRGD